MSVESFEGLPHPLDRIAEVAGLEAALLLAEEVGGTRVSFPRYVTADHWLSKLIGIDAAKAVCNEFKQLSADNRERGSGEMILPRGPANMYHKAKARFYELRENGKSVRRSGMKVSVTERTAWRWEHERRHGLAHENPDQLFLFNSGSG
jgi:hypothetical protein